MHKPIYQAMVQAAQAGGILAYSDIAPLAGFKMENPDDRLKLGAILGEISEHEHSNGRPLLSALVVHKNDAVAGSGFFELAGVLGLYRGGDKDTFLMSEIKRVHKQWKP